jgi:hypothetical protein
LLEERLLRPHRFGFLGNTALLVELCLLPSPFLTATAGRLLIFFGEILLAILLIDMANLLLNGGAIFAGKPPCF